MSAGCASQSLGESPLLEVAPELINTFPRRRAARAECDIRRCAMCSTPSNPWPCESGAYSLERLIGRGAFAKVYMATCPRAANTVERVALKVMDLEQVTAEITEISKEVQMMRMCCHANVLCCHASFVSKSELYLVMPLMEKGSCLHIMHAAKQRGLGEGMSEQWLGYVLLEVLHGLEYLHENGHIHRDIKAGNVLLDPAGNVALADFGVSSWLVHAGLRRRTAKTFVGTPFGFCVSSKRSYLID